MTSNRGETTERQIDRIFEMLKHGFSCLFLRASRHGHWEEVRSTALAGMCVQLREVGHSPWLNAIADWLRGKQTREGEAAGSWCEEIWDTAMCLIALKDLEVSSKDPAIDQALRWVASLFSRNGRGNWHDEPWETSWALLALCRCGRRDDRVDPAAAVKWLISLQSTDGLIVAPHYTAYFVLIDAWSSKLSLDDECRAEMRSARERCVAVLLRLFEESPPKLLWTGEPWSNGQILWALCEAGSFPYEQSELVEKALCWFEQVQGQDGSWLDVEDTASALLGCFSLLQLLRLGHDCGNRPRRIEVRRELEIQLQRAVRVPPFALRQRLFERDIDTGFVSINLRERTMKIVLAALTLIFVSGIGFIVNLQQFIEMVRGWFK